jgi:hypothetical protein
MPTMLDVPLLAQEQPNCCWHTAAMMIWLYHQQKSGRQHEYADTVVTAGGSLLSQPFPLTNALFKPTRQDAVNGRSE